MESYAIVQASGKQFWVEENKFYDFDKLPLDRGDTFSLNQILLVNKEDSLDIGKPYLDSTYKVEATVLRHLSAEFETFYTKNILLNEGMRAWMSSAGILAGSAAQVARCATHGIIVCELVPARVGAADKGSPDPVEFLDVSILNLLQTTWAAGCCKC
jgi:ribosomal protein L21